MFYVFVVIQTTNLVKKLKTYDPLTEINIITIKF